jgi:hypothetical protein
VDQGVAFIQNGEEVLVAVHEPLLDAPLRDGEQEANRTELLCLQHRNTMRLRHTPDSGLCEDPLRGNRSHAVESVVDYPVKHLNEERESL